MPMDAVAPRSGRPRASSREMLAEAACELFLEKGYEATSIADITRRAGVSRSSFFNYFVSKADVLWGGLDARIAAFEGAVAAPLAGSGDAGTRIHEAVSALGASFAPDALALALRNATPMGIEGELDREAAMRQARIGRAVAGCLRGDGAERLRAEVIGAAVGGAVLAALRAWARAAPGRTTLAAMLELSMSYTGVAAAGRHPRIEAEAGDA